MTWIPLIGFMVVALAAMAFAVAPLWRGTGRGRMLLVAAIALFLLGIGGGTYWMVGRPALATREAQGLKTRDVRGLVPPLIARLRKTPNDAQGWRYLGQVYLASNDPGDAAKALGRAIAISGKGDPALDSAYGEALVMASNGAVPPQAEAAFTTALSIYPRGVAARFYLGLARAQHGDRPGAIASWQSLLADIPTTAPLHQVLVDRIALLTSQSGGAPDPRQMVAVLAARLKADPHDALGWVRLVRAWHVLGDDAKARAALATARVTFKDNKDAQVAFDTAEKDLK